MFIKRLKKVEQMIVQRSGEYFWKTTTLKAFKICNDPHGRLFCFYSQTQDRIYIVSILELLEYIYMYRQEYEKSLEYSFKSGLKAELVIPNKNPDLNIFLIKLTENIQQTQFLITAYYPSLIQLHSVLNGQKIHSVRIDSQIYNNGAIMVVHPIGHSLYIGMYDSTLLCYEGNQLKKCLWNTEQTKANIVKSYPEEIMRFTYSEIILQQKQSKVQVSDGQNAQQIGLGEKRQRNKSKGKKHNIFKNNKNKSKKKILPVYQNKSGDLMIGHELVIKQNVSQIPELQIKQRSSRSRSRSVNRKRLTMMMNGEVLQDEILKLQAKQNNQSFEEFLKLQHEKYSQIGLYNRYQLTICSRFIIHKKDFISKFGQLKSKYNILSRSQQIKSENGTSEMINMGWGKIWQSGSKPYINNFCKNKQNTLLIALIGPSVNSKQKKNRTRRRAKSQKQQYQHRLSGYSKQSQYNCSYVQNEQQQMNNCITIYRLVSNKQKGEEKNQMNNQYRKTLIAQIKDLKEEIINVIWIGPEQLLFVDYKENLYYLEIDLLRLS